MLHELFLLLAGHPSPLFKPTLSTAFPFVSPSERALLNELAQLGILYHQLRTRCDLITSVHASTVARATALGVLSNLQQFQSRVAEVERLILKRDDTVVGAYDIVPLAKIVSLFSGWNRILRYLENLVAYITQGQVAKLENGNEDVVSKNETEQHLEIDSALEIEFIKEKGIRGAKLINRLRDDIHTGFPSIEKVALELLNIAEMAWLRQLSTWVLYGRIPNFGASDFMIREMTEVERQEDSANMTTIDFTLSKSNVPDFVAPQTASSILFIGRALSKIHNNGKDGNPSSIDSTSSRSVLAHHISLLQSLKTPLSPALLHSAISGIRDSLSKNTLQNLLPPEHIRDIVHVLREFYLLGRGEFAMALIEQADEKVRSRWRRSGMTNTTTPSLSGVVVKDNEVSGVLKRTWTTLSSFQSEEETDDYLEHAKDLIYLSLRKVDKSAKLGTPTTELKTDLILQKEKVMFNDILLGVPININFSLTWPLELFLTPQDLDIYEGLFHYLLSIRRASIKLQSLWQARRNSTVQGIATSSRQNELKEKREQLQAREKAQRSAWATAHLCIFFLESIGVYFQSNVIGTSFTVLEQLIGRNTTTREDDEIAKVDEVAKPIRTENFIKTVPTAMRPKTPSSRPGTPHAFGEPTTNFRNSLTSPLKLRPASSQSNVPLNHINQIEQEHQQAVDPETLTQAHHQYLQVLSENLFLTDYVFASQLRQFLSQCDVMDTQLTALHKSNEMIGILERDENTDRDDKRALDRMHVLCVELRETLGSILNRLQEMDDERSRDDSRLRRSMKDQVPRSSTLGGKKQDAIMLEGALAAAGIDKLLMKLDLGDLNVT